MRSKILPLVLIAGLSLSGAAFAASTDTTGVIKAIDAKAMTLTLEDGTVFKLPADFKADSVKVGEKVTVSWDAKGDEKDATKVVEAK